MTDSQNPDTPESHRPSGSSTGSRDAESHVPAWAIPAGSEQGFGSASTTPPPTEPVTDQATTQIPRPVVGDHPESAAAGAEQAAEPFSAPVSAVPLRRRRGLLALAGTGAAFVLAGAGFLAGAGLHRGDGNADTTTLISGSAQNPQGGGRAQSRGGFGGSGQAPGVPGSGGQDGDHAGRGRAMSSATFTAGQIASISGSTVTLKTFQGTSVRVTTSARTIVGGAAGDLSSLQVGQLIFVTGTRQSDGSYAATAISNRPAFDPDGDQSDQQGRSGQQGQQQGHSGVTT
jgi:hypothetical protein